MFLLKTTDFVPPLASRTDFSKKDRLSEGWNFGTFGNSFFGAVGDGLVVFVGSPDWQLKVMEIQLPARISEKNRFMAFF